MNDTPEARYTLITGMNMPDAGTLLGEIRATGRRVRHAGPGSDRRAAAAELFRDPVAEVPDGPLRLPEAPATLAAQSAAWLRGVFPAERITGEHDLSRAGNGLATALPFVAALLATPTGGALLLELPETGLHPRSQSALTRLACAAAFGTPVTVMTHSDHVLNQSRLTVKRGLLPAESVVIRHYRASTDGVVIDRLFIGPDGMVSYWPAGFLNEWEDALDEILDDEDGPA